MADVVVFGATGRTGLQVVLQLLHTGHSVRAFVRDVTGARTTLGDDPKLIVGDVTVPETIPAAFGDAELVVCTIGSRATTGGGVPETIDYQGVVNVVDAALEANVKHLVLVSSIGATQPDHPINKYGQVLTWKLRSEDHLRQSGLGYTIVRPGGLIDEGSSRVQFGQGDQISGRISRADVARVVLASLGNEAALGKTFEIISEPGELRTNFDDVFQSLQADV